MFVNVPGAKTQGNKTSHASCVFIVLSVFIARASLLVSATNFGVQSLDFSKARGCVLLTLLLIFNRSFSTSLKVL